MGTTVNFARVVACALVACSLAPASAAPRRDVRIGMALEPPGLDPTAGAASAIGEVTQFNVFEQLVRIKEDFTVAPGLATSWTFSDDLKTLTFKLREGVKFQNGEPFTSADVKFSFERAAAEDSTDKDKAFFASIASIDAPDPSTVTLVFKAPSYQALYHLGFASASIVEPKSAPTDAVKPVGTGPYELADWQKGSSLTLKAWPGYRDAASVKIEAATFRFISDPAAQVAAML
ncbi:MAG: ABC transporter substrate-binding protein, partial [Hyphomicrobiales bacterium]|nr:ABC transporter substrate-binding protein [Hyphomicrobiales bacterium]